MIAEQGCGFGSLNAESDADASFHFHTDPDPAPLKRDANLRSLVYRLSKATF
jgi:hypothetical protein